MDTIAHNWAALQARIRYVAEDADRDPDTIEIVAVTKTRSPQEIDAVVRCGARAVGENRVQEALTKKPQVRESTAAWHLVGHLQSNKAARAVALFDLVQSVDSVRLARALSRHAGECGRALDILIQVNTSGAAGQSGVDTDALVPMLHEVAGLDHVRVRGLMTIAAHTEEERPVRTCFAALRAAGEQVQAAGIPGVDMQYLSMGMSADFEWAIAEGANMLRLGTSIFGPRQQ